MVVISSFLTELGFDGIVLKDLETAITKTSLDDFKTFIILNDGKFKSNIELAHMYILRVRDESGYSKEDFIADWSVDQSNALENLFNVKANSLMLKKVNDFLNSGLTLEDLYDNLMKYSQYNPLHAIKLIAYNLNK